MRSRLPFLVVGLILGTVSVGIVHAWSGPSQSPPDGNVSAPVNVGAADQVKTGGFGAGSLRVTGSNGYLNFGSTEGESGYGIRDSAGVLEFKNSGGAWDSVQSVVYNLVGEGGDSYWTASGNNVHNSNSGNVGIGTASPSQKLEVGGNVRANDYYLSGYGLWASQLRLSQQLGPEYIVVSRFGPTVVSHGSISCGNGLVSKINLDGGSQCVGGDMWETCFNYVNGMRVYCRSIYY